MQVEEERYLGCEEGEVQSFPDHLACNFYFDSISIPRYLYICLSWALLQLSLTDLSISSILGQRQREMIIEWKILHPVNQNLNPPF